jgi:two-component SAPR family response regulator
VIRFRQLVPSNPPVDLDNWPWPIKIHTLGNFRIYREGNAIEFVRKVQQVPLKLLKLMIALGGTGISEEQLADILWPDTDGYSAYRAFSTTLYRLRQLLEIPDLIKVTEGKVYIDRRLCWIDSWAFEKITNEILVSRELEDTSCNRNEIQQKLEKMLIFYRGDFLKMEEWGAPVISEREKLRSLFIQLIDKIGRSLEAKELWHDAIQLYKRGLAINEFVEKFYQRLMICHFNLGEKSDAMIVFERCRKILLSGYGIEPGNKINEIRSMIIQRSN